MKKIKALAIKLWRDESGQGTAEYVLILVGIVVVAGIFRTQIKNLVGGKMEQLKGAFDKFNPN